MGYKTGSLAEKERERQIREIYEWVQAGALRAIANARKKRSVRSSDAASLSRPDLPPGEGRSRFQLGTAEQAAVL